MTGISKFATKFAGKATLATAGLVVTTMAVGTTSASAAIFTFGPTNVAGTNESGANVTVSGTFAGTDVFSLTADGTASANAGVIPATNAAGIYTSTIGGFNTGDTTPLGTGFDISSLLVSLNGGAFTQLFPANPTNGYGSATPPTSLAINNVSLSSIFGSGLNDGDVLTFKINDFPGLYSDNGGAFTVSGSATSTNVPEPFTVIGTLIGGTAAARMRKKLNSSK